MSELNQLPLQLVNLPKNQLNALQGESLTLFRFEQLDTEVFAYFQLLFNNTNEIPPYHISTQQWQSELNQMLNRFPAVNPMHNTNFDHAVQGLSNEFYCEMATRLSRIRHELWSLKIGSVRADKSPLHREGKQIAFGERWALLPLSARERLRLLLSENFLPIVKLLLFK